MANVNAILSDLSAHGLTTDADVVSHKVGTETRELPEYDIVVVNDLEKFVASFGAEKVLEMLDGTSLRVKMQSVARRLLQADRKTPRADIVKAQIESILGMTTRRAAAPKVVYADISGQTHEDKLSADQANVAIMVERGLTVEVAKQVLGL